MRLLDMFEGISKILYHITTIGNAARIAHDDAFKLSMSMRTGHEEETGTKKGIFYMSTSRLPNSEFQKIRAKNYNGAAIFVLDGERLSHNYAGEPVNYFHQFKTAKESEFEDRIYSDKPEIPNASRYIKEVHILVPNTMHSTEYEDIQLLQNHFPTYIHYDVKSFLSVRHTHDELFHDKDDIVRIAREKPDEMAHDDVHSLSWWIDALYSNPDDFSDFPSNFRNFLLDIEAYPANSLVSKLRSATEDFGNRQMYERFSSLMKQNNLRTANDVVMFLKDKWTNVHK